jgi:RNA polymerase primary sigma factor
MINSTNYTIQTYPRKETAFAARVPRGNTGWVPLLTAQKEIELIGRIKMGDQKAKKELVEANDGFLKKVARKFQGLGLDLEELTQEGTIGLLKAAKKFNLEQHDNKFLAYAVWWIKQSIKKALMEQSKNIKITNNALLPYNRMKKAINMSFVKTGKYPLDEELAKKLGKTVEEIRQLKSIPVAESMENSICKNTKDGDLTIGDTLISETADVADEGAFNGVLVSNDISKALNYLPAKHRAVMIYHYGLDGTGEKTLKETGKKFDLSRQRIQKIESTSLKKLATKPVLQKYREEYSPKPEKQA